MSKYAPANTDGLKPYTVTKAGWGRERSRVVYAATAADARYKAFGRMGVGEHITGTRRTLAEELEPNA